MRLPGPRLMRVFAMELFTKLFGDLLLFVYHCFDRIVIHGYLSGLSRPEQVVHFFRKVVGIPVLSDGDTVVVVGILLAMALLLGTALVLSFRQWKAWKAQKSGQGVYLKRLLLTALNKLRNRFRS